MKLLHLRKIYDFHTVQMHGHEKRQNGSITFGKSQPLPFGEAMEAMESLEVCS